MASDRLINIAQAAVKIAQIIIILGNKRGIVCCLGIGKGPAVSLIGLLEVACRHVYIAELPQGPSRLLPFLRDFQGCKRFPVKLGRLLSIFLPLIDIAKIDKRPPQSTPVAAFSGKAKAPLVPPDCGAVVRELPFCLAEDMEHVTLALNITEVAAEVVRGGSPGRYIVIAALLQSGPRFRRAGVGPCLQPVLGERP